MDTSGPHPNASGSPLPPQSELPKREQPTPVQRLLASEPSGTGGSVGTRIFRPDIRLIALAVPALVFLALFYVYPLAQVLRKSALDPTDSRQERANAPSFQPGLERFAHKKSWPSFFS